jgi:hypothetical protein
MPYARLVQAAEIAIDEMARKQKTELVTAAFIGYQFAAAQGALKPSTTFDKYLTSLGLNDKPKSGTLAREKEQARATAERVAALFNQAPVTKEIE